MRRRLRVSVKAATQIREAAKWWRSNRTGRDLLAEEIERGFALIRTDPGVGAPASSRTDIADLRRPHLPRVRSFIYYRPVDAGVIEVVALWHTSRGTPPEL